MIYNQYLYFKMEVTCPAGRMNFDATTKKVSPDPRKGTLKVFQVTFLRFFFKF